jgi:4-amino-4-deoxy-L-arabinose transferase-like glycosyltransferase
MHHCISLWGGKNISYLAVITFLVSGLLYCYYTPLWNPPDEVRHFVYCEYLSQNHKLPRYTPNSDAGIVGMSFHPPLYYLLGSFFCKNDNQSIQDKIVINDGPGYVKFVHPKEENVFPYSGKAQEAYLIRLLSLVLGSISVGLIYLMAIEIWPNEKLLAFTASFFVATIPQFVYISASISNEALSTTVSTAYLLSLVRYIKNPLNRLSPFVCGVLLGGCLLSKTSTIFYIPVTGCIFLWLRYRFGGQSIGGLITIVAVSLCVSGWWFLENWIHSGDLFLSKTVEAVYPWLVRSNWPSIEDVRKIIGTTFISFFGYFGALQFSISKFYLYFYGALLSLGICGLVRFVIAGKIKTALSVFQKQILGLLVLSLMGALVFFTLVNIRYNGMLLGRYLFPVIAPIAILLSAGLRSLVPSQFRNPAFVMICLALFILNFAILFRIVKPAYAEPRIVTGTDQPLFCCPTVKINKNTAVRQTFIAATNNLCAIRIMFSCTEYQKTGDMLFTLKRAGMEAKPECVLSYPLKEIKDFRRCYFIFSPIKDSMEKEYEFSLIAPSVPEGEGAALWYEAKDCNIKGKTYINNVPVDGSLYFSTYYFTGEYPKTDWEGRQQLVINDGLYIYISEQQLYNEQSKEQRVKSTTYKKKLLCEKAIRKRNSQRE